MVPNGSTKARPPANGVPSFVVWQTTQSAAGVKNSPRSTWLPPIGNGGTDRGHPGFAHAGGLFGRGHDVNLHLRRFVHAQHAIVVEVALLDAAVFQRDRTAQAAPQPEPNP